MGKGINYGELGRLCSNNLIVLPKGMPQYLNDWDSILLVFADYKKKILKESMFQIYKEWNIPKRHWRWFNTSRALLKNYSIKLTKEVIK